MDEVKYVVEYKLRGELFVQRFVYTHYQFEESPFPALQCHFYVNEETGEELSIYLTYLESMLTRPIRYDEQ